MADIPSGQNFFRVLRIKGVRKWVVTLICSYVRPDTTRGDEQDFDVERSALHLQRVSKRVHC